MELVYDEVSGIEYEDHGGEMERYRAVCAAAGLSEEDQDLLDRYYGFHSDGKLTVTEIAHTYGIREVDVHQCVRNYSLRIARTEML